MRKTILVGLVAIVAGVFLVPLLLLIAAHAAPADPPSGRPPVRTLGSSWVWVATIDHESVKLGDADTALLGGEGFLTGKPLSDHSARLWIPADRVRALAEFANRDDLEEFDDDEVLVNDEVQKVEIDTIEMNAIPDGGSVPLQEDRPGRDDTPNRDDDS